jgi:hypothetical protein
MSLSKRTYSLPSQLVSRFEHRLTPPERSAIVAKLIENWLDESDRNDLRREVIEGCQEMKELYLEIDRDWDRAASEVWRDAG